MCIVQGGSIQRLIDLCCSVVAIFSGLTIIFTLYVIFPGRCMSTNLANHNMMTLWHVLFNNLLLNYRQGNEYKHRYNKKESLDFISGDTSFLVPAERPSDQSKNFSKYFLYAQYHVKVSHWMISQPECFFVASFSISSAILVLHDEAKFLKVYMICLRNKYMSTRSIDPALRASWPRPSSPSGA